MVTKPVQINQVYSHDKGAVRATVWYCSTVDQNEDPYKITVTRNISPGSSMRTTQAFDAADFSDLEIALKECKEWLSRNRVAR